MLGVILRRLPPGILVTWLVIVEHGRKPTTGQLVL